MKIKFVIAMVLASVGLNQHVAAAASDVQHIDVRQYYPFSDVAQFGRFTKENMTEIVESTTAIVKNDSPKKIVFLVLKKVTLDTQYGADGTGQVPLAILYFKNGKMTCLREVFAQMEPKEDGQVRNLIFALSPEVIRQ